MEQPSIPPVEWEQFPLEPSWKGCRSCGEDVEGARVGIRPKLAGQTPEGIVVRVCINCGHITTMGPTLPSVANEWRPAPTAQERGR